MRREVLARLHDSHQGMVRTKERARLSVYWPGIDNDIDNAILSCKACQDTLPSHPREPMITRPLPDRPFQELAGDFCTHAGRQHLILVDCFLDWPDIIPMGNNTTAPQLTSALRSSFCRTGVPGTFWSDQGPHFTSNTFQDFAKQWGFRHATSSPTYPQSNGKAEATVKSIKKLIRNGMERQISRWKKTYSSTTPVSEHAIKKRWTLTRTEVVGHPIQDTLPAHRRAFSAEWQRSTTDAEQQALNTRQPAYPPSSQDYYRIQGGCPKPRY